MHQGFGYERIDDGGRDSDSAYGDGGAESPDENAEGAGGDAVPPHPVPHLHMRHPGRPIDWNRVAATSEFLWQPEVMADGEQATSDNAYGFDCETPNPSAQVRGAGIMSNNAEDVEVVTRQQDSGPL